MRTKPVNIDNVWGFIEEHYPNYDKSQLVARSNEIDAIFDNNYDYMSLVECEELRHEANEINLTLLMESMQEEQFYDINRCDMSSPIDIP